MSVTHYDTIVIGSGVAGLSFLHYYKKEDTRVSTHHSVALFCKAALENTNTNWAQGGIAAVAPQPNIHHDSIQSHIQDTLIAGAHVNNKEIVTKVIEEGPHLMQDLISMGMPFDTNEAHQIDLAKEGGHEAHRVWHVKDYTGKALQQTLLQSVEHVEGLSLFEYCLVVSIDKNSIGQFDVRVFDIKNNQFENYTATHVVLATGGLGQLYAQTTNAPVSTADGIYLANLLGAQIENLSFIQFHPTGLHANGEDTFLISEALRGAGAILRNHAGVNFMPHYHPAGSLAPRDIVSRAIITEMEIEKVPHQFLDATLIDKSIIESHFPSIYNTVKKALGIDLTKTYIPIVPTQHYSCGGIAVNEYGESTVAQLYAIGECAHTGLHGANRLASNSLLEGLAFAKFAADQIVNVLKHANFSDPQQYNQADAQNKYAVLKIDRTAIQNIVSKYAGVVKTTEGLLEGRLAIMDLIKNAAVLDNFSIEDYETTCMATTALLLLDNAILQTKNVGVFYNASIA